MHGNFLWEFHANNGFRLLLNRTMRTSKFTLTGDISSRFLIQWTNRFLCADRLKSRSLLCSQSTHD